MAANPTANEPQWHTLDFFTDDDVDSAITIFNANRRFHIIASQRKLGNDTKVGKDYYKLVRNAQARSAEEDPRKGSPADGLSSDSGINVAEGDEERVLGSDADNNSEEHVGIESAEDALKCWMVSPLADPEHGLLSAKSNVQTVEQFYNCPTTFCELTASEDGQDIEAIELKATPELQKRMEGLLPKALLPKYLTNSLTAPWFRSSELDVLDYSDRPVGTPYHPCRVQHKESKEVYFLKVVDNEQQQPIKRELSILHQIEQAGLRQKMNVPRVTGLVAFDNTEPTPTGRKKIMGILLTDIPGPTPLTLLLDESVEQERREKWAKEAERITDVLHEHEIIWGDAKADNFMVDRADNLWIIDFGGSYTEGWVDPELNETEEGDEMGTAKIINALKDPVANVARPDEDGSAHCQASKSQGGSKRKRGLSEGGDDRQTDKRSRIRRDG